MRILHTDYETLGKISMVNRAYFSKRYYIIGFVLFLTISLSA